MATTLRRYRPEDAPTTHGAFHAAVTRTAAADYSPAQIAAWSPGTVDLVAWDARRASAWTVVAEIDGRLVGFADLTDAGVLDMLFVHPDAGRRGVARALVEAVLAEAGARGVRRVETLASRTARPAFEALGFVVDRERPENTVRGVRVPNYAMHADVASLAEHHPATSRA